MNSYTFSVMYGSVLMTFLICEDHKPELYFSCIANILDPLLHDKVHHFNGPLTDFLRELPECSLAMNK